MAADTTDLEWERWSRLNPDMADLHAAWDAGYRAGERNGVRSSMQLGVGTTIQQLAEILARMEHVAGKLAEDEAGSTYWRSRT